MLSVATSCIVLVCDALVISVFGALSYRYDNILLSGCVSILKKTFINGIAIYS